MSTSTKENKTIVSSYAEAFNAADLAAFKEVFDPDVLDHNPPPQQAPGLDGMSSPLGRLYVVVKSGLHTRIVNDVENQVMVYCSFLGNDQQLQHKLFRE